MKIYQIIATSAMAALVLAGCNKETETPATPDPDAGMKEVSISISGLATKGQIDPSDPWAADIANIAEFDIYFTSASGVIKYAYTFKSDNEYSDAYDEFKNGGSVRFIGLKDISGVYVAANTTTKLEPRADIKAFGTVLLESYNSDITKDDVLYVGGDIDLTPIKSEPVDGVTVNVPNDETMASQSYTANIYLRPVISRIEIGDVYVEASGEYTTPIIDGKTYKYTWKGFTPKLVGIYMSNVAGTLYPMAHTVSEWFTKPTGTQIAEGKWKDLITYLDGTTADFNMKDSNMNVEKVLWYSNGRSEGGSYVYSDLFASTLGSDETVGSYTHHYYFNGADAVSATCVPFNFFVPFDVTGESMEAEAIWTGAENAANGNNPALHFQFDFSDQTTGTPYSYKVFEVTGLGDQEITKESNPDLWVQLTSRINFTTVSDGIYYANVTSFKKGVEDINVAPNSIYKLTGVGITPFNLTTGTETVEEDYNIIVKVTTVPYVIEEVTPSFDNE